ncbi:sclerostin domain-containing protein 1 [Nothobranchius furzeri]|uniref:Sclerostin domain containing 1b n=1 Tax=Nothobranchius furzeri TaxID=105023 RepID=A0A8C6MAP0_NOTFU|nr:sclerostin domain-containing protein 1 [Nothobranchius furzeri]KAF7199074.1 sclerostin domain-containing protein 1-like [Nothobranchius furzeri]
MLRLVRALQLLMLLMLRESSSAFHNNATETGSLQLVPDEPDQTEEENINQASRGRRRPAEAVSTDLDQNQVQCRELRSTKLISDGKCTSVTPIKELVCAGECLPAHLGPNWISGGKRYWSRHETQDWRCVTDRSRTQRIQLQCHNGSSRTYKITVVTSCKCKRFTRQQNNSEHKDTSAQSQKPKKTQDRSDPPEGFAEN